MDNFNAATGVLAGAGKGVLRTAFIKRDCVADIVPVDLCINLMCVLAWKTATSRSSRSTIPVYNCTSGAINTLTWGTVEREGLGILRNNPYSGVLWYPGGSFKENFYTNRLCQVRTLSLSLSLSLSLYLSLSLSPPQSFPPQLFFHYGPAQLVDIILRLLGKKPFLVKISSLMQKSTAALETFTTNSWEWSHANMDKLWAELSEEDRQLFHFDIRDLDWIQYLETYVKVKNRFIS